MGGSGPRRACKTLPVRSALAAFLSAVLLAPAVCADPAPAAPAVPDFLRSGEAFFLQAASGGPQGAGDAQDKPLSEALLEGESEEPPPEGDEDLEQEGIKSYQQTRKYATKKLENVRTSVTVFNFMYIEMKEGSAGWAHYDDLFASGVVWAKLTLGDVKFPIPIGGVELSYIGMPFYQFLLGGFYEIYTGRRRFGNEFSDLIISNVYLGIRVNLFNEYTALMQWDEMFEFSRPKHFLGINIYLKAAVLLAFWNRVTYKGAFATEYKDTYFNQTESFGYFLLAGFEYRFATIGLFFEAGWKYVRKPSVARPLVSVNHFRSFPITVGITIYFTG